ncbi:EPIDERMAL PATTERNING FACTOR-like protein 3 [Rhododendron vialii]|uniref:EPIDERMAL PATTERNING FACTOR-like protein 3 n=1 Tax=Rhododendron vialii TaxID=182163 RepID=UPI00265E91A9|nr:EPIDERMAL PATTERNING FACTOR-like protein 3 [Rhododendron vialii]
MKRRVLHFLVCTLQVMIWVFIMTIWPLASCKVAREQGYIFRPRREVLESKQGFESMGRRVSNNEEAYKGVGTLGSRPPNCDHKCGVCRPCDAIQVPATTDRVRVQYANYEPEGWKCKCGIYFFNP